MADEAQHPGGHMFRPFVTGLADKVRALGLIEADRTLDEARRIVWMLSFSGGGDSAVREFVDPPALALEIAAQLGQVTTLEADRIMLEVRLCLWMGAFAARPYTTFGKQLAAHLERQERPADPAKLN